MNWIVSYYKNKVDKQREKILFEEESHKERMLQLNKELMDKKKRLLNVIKLINKFNNALFDNIDNVFNDENYQK